MRIHDQNKRQINTAAEEISAQFDQIRPSVHLNLSSSTGAGVQETLPMTPRSNSSSPTLEHPRSAWESNGENEISPTHHLQPEVTVTSSKAGPVHKRRESTNSVTQPGKRQAKLTQDDVYGLADWVRQHPISTFPNMRNYWLFFIANVSIQRSLHSTR